jgi:TP901 family phage tail tape measure protein
MDVILEEMGSKWKTLNDDQKVALAQNVAGVRQYTQLMALMENWDFFRKNVDSARNATGALQKQQDIYLDSIAAHMEKLSAQAEKLYSSLLDSKAIKTFTDVLTGALKTINTYMTGLGGGFSSFLTLGGNAAALFSKQIGGAFAKKSINKEISKQNAANVIAQQD